MKRPAARIPGVVAFVPDAWGGPWTVRHHVLSRLARYLPVLWMDPPLEWRQAWAGPFRTARPAELPATDAFLLYRPGRFLPRLYRPRSVARLTEWGRLRRARDLLLARGAETAVLYLWRPEFARILDLLPHRVSCYHVDDEYSFSPIERPLASEEAALLGRADEVIIHSPGLWDRMSGLATRPSLIPNGVDYAAYATPAAEPDDLHRIPRPRIGYAGVVKRQLDLPLLLGLAERHPDWSFVLVGPALPLGPDEEPFAALRRRRNVHVLGPRPVAALPAYTQHFDVGIMPYDLDDYTKYIYPLKLHEYLAAGLPAVGTPIRTLLGFREVVALAEGVDAWSDALAAALEPGARLPAVVAARRAIAAAHDWGVLVRRIAMLFAERLGGPWRDRIAGAVTLDGQVAPGSATWPDAATV